MIQMGAKAPINYLYQLNINCGQTCYECDSHSSKSHSINNQNFSKGEKIYDRNPFWS